jgi:nitroimidazol reductase NimA-like FMN-containing flavoprotein (pyridoxamine 5'-phosphate oxidase superfamily)
VKPLPDVSDLGRRIAHRRTELGLSCAEMARRAGMDEGYVQYVEEQAAHLTVGAVWRLAGVLSTTPSALLGSGVERPPGQGEPGPAPVLSELDTVECRQLIAPGGIGRVALSTREGMNVIPVNFAVIDGAVVFRTAERGLLDIEGQASFEVDRLDPAMREGWSVLVVGSLARVTDPDELAELRKADVVKPWAGGSRESYMRIVADRITGRRIHTNRGG